MSNEEAGSAAPVDWGVHEVCAACDSTNVIHNVVGMVMLDDMASAPSWVSFSGCCGIGPDRFCPDCGAEWMSREEDGIVVHDTGELLDYFEVDSLLDLSILLDLVIPTRRMLSFDENEEYVPEGAIVPIIDSIGTVLEYPMTIGYLIRHIMHQEAEMDPGGPLHTEDIAPSRDPWEARGLSARDREGIRLLLGPKAWADPWR